MNILGISCFYHDSAACLIRDGKVVAAVQEERFNRDKNSSAFPINAFNYCIQEGGITFSQIDYIGFYEKPYLKFSRVIFDHLRSYPFSYRNFLRTMPNWLQDRLILPVYLKKELGYEGPVLFVKHHMSHAAGSFLVSPFEEAAILTIDGVGEYATTTFGYGKGTNVDILKEIQYPDSLGLIYTAITAYLGFRANRDEGKTMGLAAYGKPVYLDKFREIIDVRPDGSYKIDHSYFGFNKGNEMYSKKFVNTFGPAKTYDEDYSQRHYDMAASLQLFLEEAILTIVRYIYSQTKVENICLSGGVSLNCVTNQRIIEETPFKNIFILPAAGDAGGALGSATYLYNTFLGNPRVFVMDDAYTGPEYTDDHCRRSMTNAGFKFQKMEEDELCKFVAQKISEKLTVGWFQGRLEFGPRALGHRSILGDPRTNEMKDILNFKIKKREWFRPFAPIVLEDKAKDYFDLNCPSPFMLLAPRVWEEKKDKVPAITHVDGTARVQTINPQQNPRMYKLISEFENITGIPVIINTSFNSQEPIVNTPEEAISCYQRTKMDVLVLGDYVTVREG